MSEYELEPEVAGGFGPTTILDSSVHPPVVSRLGDEPTAGSGTTL